MKSSGIWHLASPSGIWHHDIVSRSRSWSLSIRIILLRPLRHHRRAPSSCCDPRAPSSCCDPRAPGISISSTAFLTGHRSIVAITISTNRISTSLWDMLICKINLTKKTRLEKNNQQIKKQPRCKSHGLRICWVHPLDFNIWSNSHTSSVPWAKASPILWYGMVTVLAEGFPVWCFLFSSWLWKRHQTKNPSLKRPAPL